MIFGDSKDHDQQRPAFFGGKWIGNISCLPNPLKVPLKYTANSKMNENKAEYNTWCSSVDHF